MAPRILIVAPHNSYRTGPFLAAAARFRATVLVASENRHSLVTPKARGLHVDFDDPGAALQTILTEAGHRPFSGIVGTDDRSTELAAMAAARLGLPHNDPAATRVARRKDLARARLREAGLPVPRHRVVDLRRPLAPQIDGFDFPCVVKPVALAASRGVIRADDAPDLLRACARVQAIVERSESTTTEERPLLLLERFIPGREVSLEGLLRNGNLEVLALFDKPDPLDGPFFEETYYVTPSRLSAPDQQALQRCVAQACAAYGLREGPIHAECRINRDGAWILEVAARTIGGLCARLLRFGTGYSLEELVLAHAMGLPLKPAAGNGGAGVLMIPIPRAGILRRVEGLNAAQRVPGVEEVVLQIREGYELVPLPEGASYLGFVFARGSGPEQAETALREAHGHLKIVVAPLWKGVTA